MAGEHRLILDAVQWQMVADVATACSLTVAMAAVLVALITYRAEVRTAADQHMHGLFKDYLLKTIDLLGIDQLSPAQRENLVWARMTLKHHVLEEMFIWVRRSWPKRRPLLGHDRRRLDFLLGWQNAMEDHLLANDRAETLAYLTRNRGCYETDYLLFVAGVLQDDNLRRRVEGRRPQWRPLIKAVPAGSTSALAEPPSAAPADPPPQGAPASA
jgi:hypothetical protein